MRRGRSEWLSIIQEYKRSGATQAAFCLRRGLKLGSFRGWLYRLRRRDAAAEVALVPVEVTESAAPAVARRPPGPDMLVAVAGVDVCFPVGADVDYVAALVVELRSRC